MYCEGHMHVNKIKIRGSNHLFPLLLNLINVGWSYFFIIVLWYHLLIDSFEFHIWSCGDWYWWQAVPWKILDFTFYPGRSLNCFGIFTFSLTVLWSSFLTVGWLYSLTFFFFMYHLRHSILQVAEKTWSILRKSKPRNDIGTSCWYYLEFVKC